MSYSDEYWDDVRSPRERKCLDCGCDISHRAAKAVRCIPCAKKHSRLMERARKGSLPTLSNYRPDKQCQKCYYYCEYGFCDYAYKTGKLRTVLHPGEPLNKPCRERRDMNK